MTRLISFLAHAVYMGTPLLFGTVGEIQNEKAGHLNLGVEEQWQWALAQALW